MAGTEMLSKPGQLVDEDTELTVKESPKYVSRGGDKLASVAEELQLDFCDKVVLDIGASTGGFTDFVLQNGAAKVYAVDVGNAQLAYRLRQDPRVVVMERTDIRKAVLPEHADMAVADLSFISLTKVSDDALKLIKPDGLIIAMAKPQFETDKTTADRYQGVIKDKKVRQEILRQFEAKISNNFEIIGSADSGVPGTKGNLERFYVLKPKR